MFSTQFLYLGTRRSTADTHGVESIPLEELENKMRRILLQSSISGVVTIANDTSEEAEVIISSFKSVKRSSSTPFAMSSDGESTGVENDVTDDAYVAQDSEVDLGSDNHDARQPQALDQDRTLKQSENTRLRAGNDRIAEGTITDTAATKADVPTLLPAHALSTESRTMVLNTQETSEGSGPSFSDNEAEESAFLTGRNGANSINLVDDQERMVTEPSKMTSDPNLQQMTTQGSTAEAEVARMGIDEQKCVYGRLLLMKYAFLYL